MYATIQKIEDKYKKPKVVDVRSGDTVRVYQRIKEGAKERTQMFEGLVIRTSNKGSLNSRILVRRIASGVGVEKSFLLHNPLVEKVEVIKRSKVRRNYLSYMRERRGKSARLTGMDFDKASVNDVLIPQDDSKEAKQAEAALEEVEKTDPQAEAHEDNKQTKKEESTEAKNAEAEDSKS
jgi:large subunit ribosomal protein L19